MKKNTLLISIVILLCYSLSAHAQQVQWLRSNPVTYTTNFLNGKFFADASGHNVFIARLDSSAYVQDSDVFGQYIIELYDSSGQSLWTYEFGSKVQLYCLEADESGNVYAAGLYMETLYFGASDSLTNTTISPNVNLFLFSLNSSGTLRWKRNVSLQHPSAAYIPAMDIHPSGNCWYVLGESLQNAYVIELDSTGQELQSDTLSGNTVILSSISFDTQGNLFLAGGIGQGPFTINNFTTVLSEQSTMFFSRINASGNCSWVWNTHDVLTAQIPEIKATINGNAFISGSLFVNANFGQFLLGGPVLVHDIFLTRVDSNGVFHWAREIPFASSMTGDFERGQNKFIDADTTGNLYVTGSIRGTIDWGNGVITSSLPFSANKTSIISFDYNGNARWAITGGCDGANRPFAVSMVKQDYGYFFSSVDTVATFGAHTTNLPAVYASVLGKINDDVLTSINPARSPSGFLSVYPNPASTEVMVSFSLEKPSSVTLYVYDVMGKRICAAPTVTKAPGSHTLTLKLSDMNITEKGVYFIEIKSGDKKSIQRFMVM